MNKFLLGSAAILFILFGVIVFTRFNSSEPDTTSQNTAIQQAETNLPEAPAQQEQTPIAVLPQLGNPEAQVTIVEFIDYKCPNCNRFHRGVGSELKEKYLDTGIARIEVRQLPFIGLDSERAAQGAYCAAEQNSFSNYNDAVFNYLWDTGYATGDFSMEFEDVLTTDKLADLAGESVDSALFTTCITEERYASAVEADMNLAQVSGVRGTPSFIIGNRTLSNQQPLSVFESLINLELR
jgi:protein-disulfide isomerase